MHKVLVHFADGFEEIEALTPVDVLRRAGCIVTMVSVTGRKEVSSTRGVTIITDKLFEEVDYAAADMIVLPGGQPGADNLDKHEGLRKKILEFDVQGKWLAAICAAPLVLGNLGILNGKKATCYPGTESYMAGATCTSHPVQVDGKIITGKGPGAALSFSLELVNRLIGLQKVEELRAKMMIEDMS
jgi:4-methyl-5(b-hydroxyethyl)-thiazole monophosphate biosynthesis